MRVVDHRLHRDDGTPVPFHASPNASDGIDPRFAVIHYTAGRSYQQSVDWLCNPKSKASAHIVIGRMGEVQQLVAFNRRAWHAGRSRWQDLEGLNAWSIGIELDNPGPLQKKPTGWCTWFGVRVPDDRVIIAPHKYGGPERGWHVYSEEQILTAYEIVESLIDAYPTITDVLGHDDIAPGRKQDPGPAFPMDQFRSWLFGRQ